MVVGKPKGAASQHYSHVHAPSCRRLPSSSLPLHNSRRLIPMQFAPFLLVTHQGLLAWRDRTKSCSEGIRPEHNRHVIGSNRDKHSKFCSAWLVPAEGSSLIMQNVFLHLTRMLGPSGCPSSLIMQNVFLHLTRMLGPSGCQRSTQRRVASGAPNRACEWRRVDTVA